MLKKLLKFTAILALINVNNSFAQVSYTSETMREQDVQKKRSLQQRSSFKDFKFRNAGPSVMSGRITDLAVNPDNTTEFFAAYATGGLWYTNNNGQSFKPVFENENVIGIGAVAMQWKQNVIWVGTGEANSSRSSYAGDGIYSSSDSGKTWQHKGLSSSGHIGKIILNPANENELWVAVIGNLYTPNKERGLYHTLDGGKTWQQSLFINENTGIIDVAVNPANLNEIFATAWYRTRRSWNFEEAGATSAVYRSQDGGATWKSLSTNGSGLPTGNGVGRMGIAIAASSPSTIYVVVDNQDHRPDTIKKKEVKGYTLRDFENITAEKFSKLDSDLLDSFLLKNDFDEMYSAKTVKNLVQQGKIKPSAIHDYLYDANTALFVTPVIGAEVYRSDDKGTTWKKVNKKGLELYNTYGYYFGNITVAPNDPNIVVIGGYELLYSNDGGQNFKRKDNVATHADWHITWIDPKQNGHWIAGNDGGVNITYDHGAHWFKANTPSVGQFYSIAVDNAKPYNVYGGLQDNGTWYGSSKTRDTDQWNYEDPYPWTQIGGGDGMQVQVDTTNKDLVAYTGSQFGYYSRRNLAENTDRKFIYPKAPLGASLYRYNWQTPILLSHYNPSILYYGANVLQRSFDRGNTFTSMSSDLSNGTRTGDVPFGTLTTISESHLQYGLLYTGADDGTVQVTKDAGHTWKNISSGIASGKYISRIVASGADTNVVYLAANGYREDDFNTYIYRSDNNGGNWKAIFNGLPLGAVNAIAEDPAYADIIYAGTDNAVYVSFNKGDTYEILSTKLPSVPVHDIKIQKRENEIVLGTHGRGIYIASLKDIHAAYLKGKK